MFNEVKRILVPVDFSPCSKRALALACDIASRYDAQLTLLHVYQTPGLLYPDGFLPASPQVYRDFVDKIDDAMAELKRTAERGGVSRVLLKASEGFPQTEIIREAELSKSDLIVIGTHEHTDLKHVLLGSVAKTVVRRASCPVLTVRMSKTAKQKAQAA